VPHNFIINLDFDGNDVWVATGKGLGRAIGEGYYPGVRRPGEGRPAGPAVRAVVAPQPVPAK